MPSTPDDTAPDDLATARAFATRFIDREFDAAAEFLDDDGREAVVESVSEPLRRPDMDAVDVLEQYWYGLHGQHGDPEGVEVAVTGDESGGESADADGDGVELELAFADGTETAQVTVADGAIVEFAFDVGYEPPAYADESAFDERDVAIDADDVSLDGILAVPTDATTDEPVPGVVIVHGRGIHDSDGSAESAKLLRDVAWGLASRGIASLRYEKRLAEHDVPDDAFTLDRVVVDDAIAALDRLATAAEVDADALFVVGHSQGGMAAPRIADRHGALAGVVNLDGSATTGLDPEDADIIRYEFDIHGDLDDEAEAQIEEDRETFRRIQAGEFEDDETLMDRPGVWHRSLNAYDPAATAGALDVPLFVANTHAADPDAMPEMDAFLRKRHDAWRTTDLSAGSRVELYEGLDHHLQSGYPPRAPFTLVFPANASERVIADVTDWIHETATASR